MPDPFEALRAPADPIDPDPLFAAHLRARLVRALGLPKGVTVSDLSLDPTPPLVTDPMREGDIGYVSLWVPDLERAAAFFGQVLGWTYRPGSGAEGRQIEGVTPHHGLWGGHERGNLFLCYLVDDVAAAADRILAAGGETRPPTSEPYGLVSGCVDNQGTPFAIYQAPADQPATPRGPLNGHRHGDVSYVTMEVQHSAAARAFYGAVLGWQFSPGRVDDGWGVDGVVPMAGMHGGHEQATTLPVYRVDDIVAAVERVRALGGRSTDPDHQPYGFTVECADDQGTRFYLHQE